MCGDEEDWVNGEGVWAVLVELFRYKICFEQLMSVCGIGV